MEVPAEDCRHLALAGRERLRYPCPVPCVSSNSLPLTPAHSRLLTLTYIVARSSVGDAVQFADELLEFAFARNDQKGSVQLVNHAHSPERGPDLWCAHVRLRCSSRASEGGILSQNLKNIGSALKDLETMRSTLVHIQPSFALSSRGA